MTRPSTDRIPDFSPLPSLVDRHQEVTLLPAPAAGTEHKESVDDDPLDPCDFHQVLKLIQLNMQYRQSLLQKIQQFLASCEPVTENPPLLTLLTQAIRKTYQEVLVDFYSLYDTTCTLSPEISPLLTGVGQAWSIPKPDMEPPSLEEIAAVPVTSLLTKKPSSKRKTLIDQEKKGTRQKQPLPLHATQTAGFFYPPSEYTAPAVIVALPPKLSSLTPNDSTRKTL